jgi:dCTP deaminase
MLSKRDIMAAMDPGRDIESRLIITPLLEATQIGDTSVDLRLGSEFIVMKRANIPCISPLRDTVESRKIQESLLVTKGREVVLHPGELILGASFEYIRLPNNIAAYVTSRSSWGRLGLAIATAVSVAPGYCGIITLELTNVGNVPLVLSPGVRIAQILFHRSEGATPYEGKYRCPTSPALGKIHLDPELPFWGPTPKDP